jgi:hypothetical protein
MLEDVIVRVRDFYFPVDFIVLDMEVPEYISHTPIILGRPFLATAKANIDCESGKIELKFREKTIKLDIFRASSGFDCEWIEEIKSIEVFEDDISSLDLEETSFDILYPQSNETLLESLFNPEFDSKSESLFTIENPAPNLAVDSTPMLELKPLLDSLKCVYLESDQTYPVIINSHLTKSQESKLIKVL